MITPPYIKKGEIKMENKIFKKIIAYCLMVVCSIGLCVTATSCSKTKDDSNNPEIVEDEASGGMEVTNFSSKGIKLQSKKISYENYHYYGVSPTAETSQLLTATVGPNYATNQSITWTVSWKNENSTWAKGKTVTDYVTVVPTSIGAKTATVSNMQAFGEQVIVKATSQSDPEVYASVTVDYAKRLTGGYVKLGTTNEVPIANGGWGVNIGLDTKFMLTEEISKREFGEGTVNDTFTFSSVIRVIESALAQASAATGYTYTAKPGINFSTQTSSFSDLIYFDNKPVAGSALEQLNDYLYNNPMTELFQIEITYRGAYSNYLNIIPFYLTEDALFISVASVELDKSSLVF